MDLNLGMELGAAAAPSTQRLTLYVPNKDKDDNLVPDLDRWLHEARKLLTSIGGGSTALPPADGTWLTSSGNTIWEQTTIIYCFILPEAFRAALKNLRELLHRFGRETNQGEVVVEFDGFFYRIRTSTNREADDRGQQDQHQW